MLGIIAAAGCGRVGFDPLGASGPGGSQGSGPIPTDSLVLHFGFEEGGGVFSADLSGNGHHGMLIDPQPGDWTTGIRGSAVRFVVPEYFLYDCAGCPSFPCAVSLWFAADTLQGALFSYAVSGNVDNEPIQRTIAMTNGFLHVGQSRDRWGAPLSLFQPGRWHHLVVNYADPHTMAVFVDGGDGTVPTPDYWNSGSFSLARRLNFSALQYLGAIDEVRLYSRTLTDDEIAALAAESN